MSNENNCPAPLPVPEKPKVDKAALEQSILDKGTAIKNNQIIKK